MKTLALIGALIAAQDPLEVPPSLDSPQETLQRAAAHLDWVIAVVGNDIIRFSDLEIEIRLEEKYSERLARGEPEEAVRSAALSDMIDTLLKVQGGEDQGYDPALVEGMTDQAFDRWVGNRGGPLAASRLFQGTEMTPERYRLKIRDDILAETWSRSYTGRAAGPTGRVSVDRFVRPGWKYSAYKAFRSSRFPGERTLVGQQPEKIVLQTLILDAERYGGPADTLELANGLLETLDEGADFDELVLTWGVDQLKPSRGVTSPLPIAVLHDQSFRRHQTQALSDFAETAGVGVVSDPMPGADPSSQRRAVYVYRLVERIAPTEARPFLDLEVQKGLEEHLTQALDGLRIETAIQRLEQASFIWPENLRRAVASRRASLAGK